jgi:carbamoyl-phosphate synthase large subunit
MKIDSGIAVASRTINLPEVIQSAIRTAEIIGIRGIANVQFKRGADGVFKLLEVNPRFPGTLPLTIAAGIDMPKLMVDELMGRPVPDKLMPFKELMVVRYWTEHYFEPREWEVLCRQRSVG